MKTTEKISLLRERFIHRSDVFAVQWFNKDKGGGYYPKRVGWCPHNPPCVRSQCENIHTIPLADYDLLQHLKGEVTLGTYALDSDNTVRWLCFDVDIMKGTQGEVEEVQAHTLKLAKAVNSFFGRGSYLVEESGNRGYHLWMFFDRIDATNAYALGHFLRGLIEPHDRIQIEVYPKQTITDNLGNLVKIPLGVHRKTSRRCFFVDGHFQTKENQWEALANVKVFTQQEIQEFLTTNRIEIPVSLQLQVDDRNYGRTGLPCMTRIMEKGLTNGTRDIGMFRLAVFLKDRGLPKEAARAVLDTTNNIGEPLTPSEISVKLESAYQRTYSPFPCSEPTLDSYCSSRCRFWEDKVKRRWNRDPKEAIGRISAD